jgi:hypothetical protein
MICEGCGHDYTADEVKGQAARIIESLTKPL